MKVVGQDRQGRPLVLTPGGMEKLDYEEILRHRYLGVYGDEPHRHFLGGADEITFGGSTGEISRRWRRLTARGPPRKTVLWQNAYREIGRICSWLALPGHIREEITRIYANLRKLGLSQRTSLEKQLAKITWLACLVHRHPRTREEIDRGLRELYGHGIGRVPRELAKAADTRWVKFHVAREKELHAYELVGFSRAHRCLGAL